MTELELAQAILDYIKTTYNAIYIGYLKVEKLNPGYKMSIGLPSYMYPTTIACDLGTDEQFLNFIFEELRTRNYIRQDYYKVVRLRDGEDVPTPWLPSENTQEIIILGFTYIFPFTLN